MADLIDTHCHLTHGRLRSRLAEVLARAGDAGVTAMIAAASHVADSAAAAALADRHDAVYCTAGVHPHDAKDAAEGYLDALADLARRDRNVAIGEIGLDYHYDFSPRDAQRRVFVEQLALAARLGKPVVVHTREALDDTLAVLAESGFDARRAVFHSFSGPPAACERVLATGATVGFSGIATFKRADDVRRSAAIVPDDRLLVETDAPFLSPEPVRRMKVNEPANVAHVAARLARVRGVDPDALAERTSANARRFFGLSA